MRWQIDRSHRAALLEFAIPTLAAVLYLKVAASHLGPDLTGVLVLLSTVAAFVANLEVMGGRAIAGRVVQTTQPVERGQLIGTGLTLSTIGALILAVAQWAGTVLLLSHTDLPEHPSFWILMPFAACSAMAHIANYLGWCRLGLNDGVGRSRTVIAGNFASLAVTALLSLTDTHHPLAYALPFFCRDGVSLIMASRWFGANGYRFGFEGWPEISAYRRIAASGFLMALIVGLFEPLLKMFIALVITPAILPAFEILLRLLAAMRNGITVFLQTFTVRITGHTPAAFRQIQRLDVLTFSLAVSALLFGLLVIYGLADFVVPGSRDIILPLYLVLIPSFALYAATLPRYLALYLNGQIGRLLLVHATLGLLPLLMALFYRNASLEVVSLAFSASYFIGGVVTYLVGARWQGPFGGFTWAAGALVVVVPVLCLAAASLCQLLTPGIIAVVALLCAAIAGAVTLKVYHRSTAWMES